MSEFRTIITDYETDEVLECIPNIIRLHKDDKITIKGVNYEVICCDWNV